MKKNRILLLEDDELLSLTIVELLELEGFEVEKANTGNEAIDLSYDEKFDLYIFDINVPDINGIELLSSLREASDDTPTIFISALIDLNSMTKAFEAGGYDYIKKPFFPEELLLRINTKLSLDNQNIKYNDLEYNQINKILKKEGQIISLGEVQSRLFEQFIQNIGKIVAKEILLDVMDKPSNTALRVAITKLKQTTGLDIKNIRGIGYTIE